MKIGVLALQGAFAEHVAVLRAIGVEAVEVRLPEHLEEIDGLILPGGESTAMRRLIDRWGMRGPILDLAASGAPLFGTCAGMIVLAREIADGEEPILPLLDVTVERNAFGRQLDSFETELPVPLLGDTPVHAVFIRAPVIQRAGPDVDVLARLPDGRIVAVRERNVIAARKEALRRHYKLDQPVTVQVMEVAEGGNRVRLSEKVAKEAGEAQEVSDYLATERRGKGGGLGTLGDLLKKGGK
ncbi:MAG TPA: pyridoxal 5'-phosphate synthase glutaminase subunit PdxT [Syntrophobacteraceae bacterium]|nr:pyridoxal 5'-phosphate synthase glutaminase subunit PdxT [Syntrophobacteraceae bacterium]